MLRCTSRFDSIRFAGSDFGVRKLGYEEEALSRYMGAGQVLATVADVN